MEQMKLTLSIRHSLEFARTLLSSLNLAHEMLVNITLRPDDWMPAQACHAALMRMTVCQQCHEPGPHQQPRPYYAAPPCENYCLNVVNGCMNDLYDLNRFWSEHINALAHFKENMIQMNNIENVMSTLDDRLLAFMATLQQQYNSSVSSEQLQQHPSSFQQSSKVSSNDDELSLPNWVNVQ